MEQLSSPQYTPGQIRELEQFAYHPWAWERWIPQETLQWFSNSFRLSKSSFLWGHHPRAGLFCIEKNGETKQVVHIERTDVEIPECTSASPDSFNDYLRRIMFDKPDPTRPKIA